MRCFPAGLAGAFTYPQAAQAGWATSTLSRGIKAGWLARPYRGVYLPLPATALSRAAAVVLATGGVASHVTAARVHGLWLIDRDDWATVLPDVHRTPRPGLHLVREPLGPRAVTRINEVPLTTPERTLIDLCRRGSRLQAVCAIESALRAGLVSKTAWERLRTHRLAPVRERAGLADPASESPLETAVRLLLEDAGIRVASQVTIRDRAGEPVARLDLVIAGSRVAVECDGKDPHSTPQALYHDRSRANALAGSWRLLRFTWADVYRDGLVVATVRATLNEIGGRRRGSAPNRTREWRTT
ncbi:MAG: type IV toxin-antitoxin system AbiEi family antitoxin domain-containing protein [Mycobacteriales bacterium]